MDWDQGGASLFACVKDRGRGVEVEKVGAENTSQRSRCEEEKRPGAKRVKLKCQTKKKKFLAHFHSSEVNEKKPSLQ